MLGCYSGQLLFILRAASNTLPTAVNLQRWHIQCNVKCSLCECVQQTTAHILNGCPTALSQGCFTYQHDQVLHCLALGLSGILAELNTLHVYVDLPGMRVSKSPQGTIPSSLIVTSSYHPDIVIHNVTCNSVALLELTCRLESMQHLESVRDRKHSKEEYLPILSGLDCMGVSFRYDTIKLIALGHYLPSTLTSLYSTFNFF